MQKHPTVIDRPDCPSTAETDGFAEGAKPKREPTFPDRESPLSPTERKLSLVKIRELRT